MSYDQGLSYGYDEIYVAPSLDSYVDYNHSISKHEPGPRREAFPRPENRINNPHTSYDYGSGATLPQRPAQQMRCKSAAFDRDIYDYMRKNAYHDYSDESSEYGDTTDYGYDDRRSNFVGRFVGGSKRPPRKDPLREARETINELKKKITEFEHKHDLLFMFIVFLVAYIFIMFNSKNGGVQSPYIIGVPSSPGIAAPVAASAPVM